MPADIQNLMTDLESTRDKWNSLVERWSAVDLPMDQGYARLYGASFREFNKRVLATLDLIGAIQSADENAQLMFMPKMSAALSQLKTFKAHADSVLKTLSSHPTALLKDTSNTLESIAVQVNGSTVNHYNFAQYLDQINAAITALYDLVTAGMRFGRAKGMSIYLAYGNQLQELAGEVKALHGEVTKLKGEIVDLVASANQSISSIEQSVEKAGTAARAAEEASDSIKEASAEAEAKLASIRETAKAAGSLQTQVETYGAAFDAFQESLESRISSHEKFEKDASTAMSANKVREQSIDDLIDKADTMIRGATTAGLSKSLDEARDTYEKRLATTGWWFLGSVVVLLVCLLPIAGQLVPGPWQEWFRPVADGQTDPWLATLGKIILLLPATWATAFFASNYAELFHLSREYAHKAAMAKAVDGFKREAPEYKEEIVAGVFMEIRENPRSRKGPEPAKPQNPITESILEKIIGAIRLKKGEEN